MAKPWYSSPPAKPLAINCLTARSCVLYVHGKMTSHVSMVFSSARTKFEMSLFLEQSLTNGNFVARPTFLLLSAAARPNIDTTSTHFLYKMTVHNNYGRTDQTPRLRRWERLGRSADLNVRPPPIAPYITALWISTSFMVSLCKFACVTPIYRLDCTHNYLSIVTAASYGVIQLLTCQT